MKNRVIGVVLVIIGVALGLYCGLWWALIGGICDVIREIRAPVLQPMGVAAGVMKVMFAGFIGAISSVAFVVPGLAMARKG